MVVVARTLLVGSSAFGMTIRLISASVHDYNDNTDLCSRGGERGGAQCPLRGAQVFRLKFFLRRCAAGRDHLLARLSCLCAPIQKGWTTGCRVNVISHCVFVPSPLGFTFAPITASNRLGLSGLPQNKLPARSDLKVS